MLTRFLLLGLLLSALSACGREDARKPKIADTAAPVLLKLSDTSTA